jgi:transcriptional regulator with XRE-family HTH domain
MSSVERSGAHVPTWTLGNRLWRARSYRGLTQQQLASELQIGLRQVKEAEADKRPARRATVLAWALVCGVDPTWLEYGEMPSPNDPTTGDTSDNSGVNTIRYLLTPPLALTA